MKEAFYYNSIKSLENFIQKNIDKFKCIEYKREPMKDHSNNDKIIGFKQIMLLEMVNLSNKFNSLTLRIAEFETRLAYIVESNIDGQIYRIFDAIQGYSIFVPSTELAELFSARISYESKKQNERKEAEKLKVKNTLDGVFKEKV